jgi:molybdate transport system substrate-binding protein
VVAPDDSSTKIEAAADLGNLKRIAIGDPVAVPAGVYAKAWLTKAGLWEQIGPKCVANENVRAALAAVESGNVDAAIVYKTDAAVSKKARIAWTVPAGDAPAIVYPVAVCSESKHAAEAERFAAYLKSEKAAAVFVARGFGIAGK